MDINVKFDFIEKWNKYFPESEMPIACFYSDELHEADFPPAPPIGSKGYTCLFAQLAAVRRGSSMAFNHENLACFGASGKLGFSDFVLDDKMINFLLNKEKYLKSDKHLFDMEEHLPKLRTEKKYIIFKPWNLLCREDEPEIVCFFAKPDMIAGLFSLANYDGRQPHGVITPFGSGCENLVAFPMNEMKSDEPKAVLGGFDPSMRTCIKSDLMTFSVPYKRLVEMFSHADDCFLNTSVWKPLQKRIASQ